tara:strand:- start:1579 stop:2001 length:423 start_codon:yes stop_codon:yes gene_type:complete
MRASEVKTAIVSALEAIAPDSNAGGEAFVYVDLGGRDPSAITERAFLCVLTSVSRALFVTLDCQVVTYQVVVFFTAYTGVEDRIADDSERMIKALNKLHEQNQDLYAVEFAAVDVDPSRIMDGMLEASLDITATYRRTGV